MNRTQAIAMLGAVRRAGAELAKALADLRADNPEDLRRWELATARSLGALHVELLDPILADHPEITPPELGGPPK